MSEFLAPYSHWVFGHRNTVIVFLCLALFFTALHALVSHWRAQRLEQDLRDAQRNASRAGERRYSARSEEPIEQAPGLPPVRGGRTYARNLGTALQKAGMAAGPPAPLGPPIYSPPAPGGWTPNMQGSQHPQPPYAPPPPPWAAPAPGAPSWPYPPPIGPVRAPAPAPAAGPGFPQGGQPMPPPAPGPPAAPPPPAAKPDVWTGPQAEEWAGQEEEWAAEDVAGEETQERPGGWPADWPGGRG